MSEQNKAIVGQWLDEFWNKGNVAIVDELGAPTVLLYYPLTGELRGRENLKQMIRQFRTAFPDASFSLEGDFIAEGDKWWPAGKVWLPKKAPSAAFLRLASRPRGRGSASSALPKARWRKK